MSSIRFVLTTCGREQILIETLRRIQQCVPATCDAEIVVIDNGCAGGVRTAVDVAGFKHPSIRVIEARENRGPCNRQLGLHDAATDVCIMLADDAHLEPGSIERMLGLFEANRDLAATGFVPRLPDGSVEACALPDVFVGCAVGLRTSAVRDAGGLDTWVATDATCYDLAFRLVSEGWHIGMFEELVVHRFEAPARPMSTHMLQLDARNSAFLASRYLPDEVRRSYMHDWANRSRWMLHSNGDDAGFAGSWLRGTARGLRLRREHSAGTLTSGAFEQLFRWNEVHERMASLADTGVDRISLVGLGKNTMPFLNGAWHAGIEVIAVIDDRPFTQGRTYRGLPIVSSLCAVEHRGPLDALVISETSPARTREILRATEHLDPPVCAWFDRFTPMPVPA